VVCASIVGAFRVLWMLPLNNSSGLGAVSEIIVASLLVAKKILVFFSLEQVAKRPLHLSLSLTFSSVAVHWIPYIALENSNKSRTM
jgi:hypothetical protein